jgi:hypothetical protein
MRITVASKALASSGALLSMAVAKASERCRSRSKSALAFASALGAAHGKKAVVADKKLRLQNTEPVEFGEEIGGCVGNGANWIGGLEPLIVAKGAMGCLEIEIVHLPITAIEQICLGWEPRATA